MRFLILLSLILMTSCGGGNSAKQDRPIPTARGAAFLALLHPRFPVQDAISVLQASPHPAFSFVHKSFGDRYENLRLVIDSLLNSPTDPRDSITVVVYLDCGPCRRRPPGLFPLVNLADPTPELRHIESNLPQFAGAVNYYIVPGLEDAFSDAQFDSLAANIAAVFAGRHDWQIASNKQYNLLRAGVRNEVHSYNVQEVGRLDRGDVINGDGHRASDEAQRNLVRVASDKGVITLLWRPEWQGLPPGIDGQTAVLVKPEYRNYTISGIEVLQSILKE